MGSSVLGVPYGAGYMWGCSVLGVHYYLWSRVHGTPNTLLLICTLSIGYPMEQGTCAP